MLAPIALFCYRRLGVLERVVEALKNNELALQSDLIVFADGYKNDEDKKGVKEVREYIKTLSGFKSIKIIESSKNKGLANSIIDGVTKVVNEYGKIIVVEDDILTSPYFLNYMNDALVMYERDEDVACISAYTYPIKTDKQSFFIKGADCWGWATWKRGWECFEVSGQKLFDELNHKNLSYECDFDGSYPYTQMLKDQIDGKNDSWAIRWYISCFLKNKLCLYLGKPVATNIGFGVKGATHCVAELPQHDMYIYRLDLQKIQVKEDMEARKLFELSLRENFTAKKTRSDNKYKFFFKKEKQGDKRLVSFFGGVIKFSYTHKDSKRKFFSLGGGVQRLMDKCAFNPKVLGIFFNPFYFARVNLYKNISELSTNIVGKNLLDVGCGTKPYKNLFNVSQYDGLEYSQEQHGRKKNAEYIYDGHRFPFENEVYENIISNEVLEHIFNPDEFLSEINRVLKMNGNLLLTVPFVWDEHEQPYDFARYTSFAMKHLFDKYGFKIVEYKKSCNDLGVIFQLLNDYIYKKLIGRSKLHNLLLVNFLCSIFNILGILLIKITPKNDDLYLDNIILAKKVKNI